MARYRYTSLNQADHNAMTARERALYAQGVRRGYLDGLERSLTGSYALGEEQAFAEDTMRLVRADYRNRFEVTCAAGGYCDGYRWGAEGESIPSDLENCPQLPEATVIRKYAPATTSLLAANDGRGRAFYVGVPVLRYIAHSPGTHKCGLRSDVWALEMVTKLGSRWQGFARCYINSRLRMVCELLPGQERDEVLAKWEDVPANEVV